jgi:type II secretory pathway component GspD/PulD (secretin)
MKTIKSFISLAGVAGGLFAGTALLAADATPAAAPPDQAAVAPAATNAEAASSTNADFPPDKGIRLQFVDAQLETVLNYLSKAAGFVIHPEVSLSGRVTVTAEQPLSKEDALLVVESAIADNGYAVIRDVNILTIRSSAEVKRSNIPTHLFTRLEDIPQNAETATWIIPVRTLNPVALVQNLRPLIGTDTDLQANESANSLLVTDTQINVRRIADIVMKLDSVSSSINSIEVFPLKYADSKSIADLVKQLFPSADTSGGAGRGGMPGIGGFAGRGGAGGGRGGRGGNALGGGGFGGLAQLLGGGAADNSGSTPQSRISAVSDDHSNSLIVSAPEDLIPIIRELVQKLDQPIEDVTEVRMFKLKNADCTEMASMLASLFPDPNSTDATARPTQFGGAGGGRGGARGGAAGGFGGAAAGGAGAESEYMKKLASVIAVPDPRTQSLLVSASKDLMPQIDDMIKSLDEETSGQMHSHTIPIANAETIDLMQIITDIYPQGQTSSRANTTQNNPLLQRMQTLTANFNSSGPGSGTSTSTSGSKTATGF